MLTFGSLFAGIGGIDLGLERAGMQCKWQVEIDDYATRILAKHWPDVHRERDVRTCGAHNLETVDVIAGGFPCQDISVAGEQVGIDGERSGLWREFARIIRELRPAYVLVENVPNLLNGGDGRWFGRVLGDLATSGYDAEWSMLSACALGAPQTRERLFVVAYADEKRSSGRRFSEPGSASITRRETSLWAQNQVRTERLAEIEKWWTAEPGVGRVADGISHRLDRLGALGNAVVPAVAEFAGYRINVLEGYRNAIRQTTPNQY